MIFSFQSRNSSLSILISIKIGWSCRILWLHLCKRDKTHTNKCPGHDTKLSDGEAPVLKL